jgi:NSS family neurotransmitter:Na+ symporter
MLLVFAAWSSAISLIEPAVAWLVENRDVSRRRAAVIIGFGTWLLGLLTVFSFNIGESWTLFGKTPFDLLDFLTANIMLPLGGLLIAIFAGWVMKRSSSEEELNIQSTFLYLIWRGLIKYVSPVAVVIIFLNMVGLINLTAS